MRFPGSRSLPTALGPPCLLPRVKRRERANGMPAPVRLVGELPVPTSTPMASVLVQLEPLARRRAAYCRRTAAHSVRVQETVGSASLHPRLLKGSGLRPWVGDLGFDAAGCVGARRQRAAAIHGHRTQASLSMLRLAPELFLGKSILIGWLGRV